MTRAESNSPEPEAALTEPPFAITAPAVNSVFVANTETALSRGPAKGNLAEKVLQISDRSLWYPDYQTVVLPGKVDPDYQDYIASHGRKTNVLVPRGVNPESLSICDGFSDEAFQEAVKDNIVEAYVADDKLAALTEYHGGIFVGGRPGSKTRDINDKARFAELTDGVMDVPPGATYKGIFAIALAVQTRLRREGKAFVRHTESGGGFGNRAFALAAGQLPSFNQIRNRLVGGHPHMWQDGTALVEKFMRFKHFPGVNFNQGKFTYDNLGIHKGSNYIGCWSPVPGWIAESDYLAKVGNYAARSVDKHTDYHLNGNVDMGITEDGSVIGFEINGRMTGSRHAIAIGELLFNTPWSQWREAGYVVKSVDKFILKNVMTFAHLHDILDRKGLLASRRVPYGVVISIAPHDTIAGIHIQAGSYGDAESLAAEVQGLIGNPNANWHASPLAA